MQIKQVCGLDIGTLSRFYRPKLYIFGMSFCAEKLLKQSGTSFKKWCRKEWYKEQ